MDESLQQGFAIALVVLAVIVELMRRHRKKKAGKAGCDGCESGTRVTKKGEQTLKFYKRS